MFTLTHHTPPVNTGGSSEAQRELATRYRRRVALPVACARLNGDESIPQEALLRRMRLLRKRRSVQQAAVELVVTALQADGVLPRDFKVIR